MLYWSYNEPTYRLNGGIAGNPGTILQKAVDAGLSYGMKYIEIYRKDVLYLPTVIHYAHNALAAPVAPTPTPTPTPTPVATPQPPTGFRVTP